MKPHVSSWQDFKPNFWAFIQNTPSAEKMPASAEHWQTEADCLDYEWEWRLSISAKYYWYNPFIAAYLMKRYRNCYNTILKQWLLGSAGFGGAVWDFSGFSTTIWDYQHQPTPLDSTKEPGGNQHWVLSQYLQASLKCSLDCILNLHISSSAFKEIMVGSKRDPFLCSPSVGSFSIWMCIWTSG